MFFNGHFHTQQKNAPKGNPNPNNPRSSSILLFTLARGWRAPISLPLILAAVTVTAVAVVAVAVDQKSRSYRGSYLYRRSPLRTSL